MTIFNAVVDTYETLYRIYMRMHGYLDPTRDAKTFFGATLSCNIRDFIQRRIYFFNIYEPNLSYFFINTLQEGDTIVDVGANIGYFSLLASTLVGQDGKVISIEAAPETFHLLQKNIERNACKNIHALNVAATLEETAVAIVRNVAHNSGANTIKIGTGKVPGRPISTIIGNDISSVHFIKIDIEGSEAPVLENILQNIRNFPQRLTIVAEISENSARYVDAFRLAGFRIAGLPNNYSIGYLLIRQYLGRSDEDTFSVIRPVGSYTPRYRDYVFTRL